MKLPYILIISTSTLISSAWSVVIAHNINLNYGSSSTGHYYVDVESGNYSEAWITDFGKFHLTRWFSPYKNLRIESDNSGQTASSGASGDIWFPNTGFDASLGDIIDSNYVQSKFSSTKRANLYSEGSEIHYLNDVTSNHLAFVYQKDSANIHYGYISFSRSSNTIESVVLNTIAWESEASTPITVGVIPEPSTYALFVGGLVLSSILLRRRIKA